MNILQNYFKNHIYNGEKNKRNIYDFIKRQGKNAVEISDNFFYEDLEKLLSANENFLSLKFPSAAFQHIYLLSWKSVWSDFYIIELKKSFAVIFST